MRKIDLDDDENFDEHGILKDGHKITVGLSMMDRTQRAISRHFKTGFVFNTDTQAETQARRRAEHREFAKAELSAAWKGGLEPGDHLTLADRRMVVLDHVNEKPRLAEITRAADAEYDAQMAYDEYCNSLSNAWKTFPPDKPDEPTNKEWAMAGPLGDGEQQDGQSLKDEALNEYLDDLENAWRR